MTCPLHGKECHCVCDACYVQPESKSVEDVILRAVCLAVEGRHADAHRLFSGCLLRVTNGTDSPSWARVGYQQLMALVDLTRRLS